VTSDRCACRKRTSKARIRPFFPRGECLLNKTLTKNICSVIPKSGRTGLAGDTVSVTRQKNEKIGALRREFRKSAGYMGKSRRKRYRNTTVDRKVANDTVSQADLSMPALSNRPGVNTGQIVVKPKTIARGRGFRNRRPGKAAEETCQAAPPRPAPEFRDYHSRNRRF